MTAITWTLFLVWISVTPGQEPQEPRVSSHIDIKGFETASLCAEAGHTLLNWYQQVDRMGLWAWNVAFECERTWP